MKFYQNLKIGNKLLLINIIPASLAMLILVTSIAAIILLSSRNSLIQEITNQAYMLGESLAASIAFNDFQSAETILAALHWSPHIQQVVVVDTAGKIFAAYPRSPVDGFDQTASVSDYFTEIRVQHVIQISTQTLGEIYIDATLDPIYLQLRKFALFALLALIVACALGILMLKRMQLNLIRPIVELTDYMRMISSTNDYSLRFHLGNNDELGELATGFNAMLDKIESHRINLDHELLRRKEAESRLHQFAYFDNVTRLPNRHYFKERLENIVNATLKHNTCCCVMLIDLDDFKHVNDTLGHHVGDELLFAVAQRLNQDLREGDVLCRIGGDEFAMILENTQNTRQVELIAERVINKLSLPFMLSGKEVFIGASIGASFCPDDTTDIPTLLRNADNAMYSAKNRGKNHCLIYKPEMETKSMKRFTLEHALRRALEQKELFLLYQPLIDIHRNQVIGFEALVRWRNPSLGMINTSDFIPIAEEIGLIVPIGEFVLRTACAQMRDWKNRYGFEGIISVNISGRQLTKPGIVENIAAIAQTAGLPYQQLMIELTESILMDHSQETLDKLEKLNQLGFSIAVDDFGTGYSSMSYLKRYPLKSLKIDRSFIADLPEKSNDVAITKAIIAMGRSLGMKITAEGVEAPQQLDFLIKHQCDIVQGFYYGAPMSAEQAERFITGTPPPKPDKN
ncbi:MAG: EAL domain-containing protein [Nitrosomonas sp.]|nr:MAG: EAL domain-containing protein [Nitrosomonas sp.]